ncbi:MULTISPECIES: hypothetical protein [unclassified Lentimonas]|uniref:hypothetical protein n=1 Tax=unclassified Lentimonas TaxID=2630993 RepID=UPI0013245DDC|nr:MULTISPECIES: hypothetical protein [unclassified Lentimonas]CAA6693011.1 Unannotated [Lentimonas sp. CC10]CAA6695710.1 Unannotated [Lentimonas sp. CC19]CAA7070001.1 Unannotated [Lentimonas sp. CC11]
MSRNDPIYKFEPVHQNPCGRGLNERVSAVYALEGFIHHTYRNDPDHPQGKPHWAYIKRGGKLTGLESDVSQGDLQAQLSGEFSSASISASNAVFRLYIGLNAGKESQLDRGAVFEALRRHFESFTVSDALGCFRGEQEPSLVVTLVGESLTSVKRIASELRAEWKQDGIGIEHHGIYERVTV